MAASAAALVSNSSPEGQDSRKTDPPLWGALQRGFWRVPKLAPLVGNPGNTAAAWVNSRRRESKKGTSKGGTKFASVSGPSSGEAGKTTPMAGMLAQALAEESGTEGIQSTDATMGEPIKKRSSEFVNSQPVVNRPVVSPPLVSNPVGQDHKSALYKGGKVGHTDSNSPPPKQRVRIPTPQQVKPTQPGSGFWSKVQAGAGRQLGRKGQSNLLPFCKLAMEEDNEKDSDENTGQNSVSASDTVAPEAARITSVPLDLPETRTATSAHQHAETEPPQLAEPQTPKPKILDEAAQPAVPLWGWSWAEQIMDRVPAVRMAMPSMPSMPNMPNMPSVSMPSVPMPSVPMPSYVPFGHLYLLMATHAEHIGSVE